MERLPSFLVTSNSSLRHFTTHPELHATRSPKPHSPVAGKLEIRLSDLLPFLELGTEVVSHAAVLAWLQGAVQKALPHEIAMVVWADGNLARIEYDLLSRLPGVRTETARRSRLRLPELLLDDWQSRNYTPFLLSRAAGFDETELKDSLLRRSLQEMKFAVAHGVRDRRGDGYALYVFLGRRPIEMRETQPYLQLLVPYIDMVLRQVPPLRPNRAGSHITESEAHCLTAREREVLYWVRAGKTNEVIGTILGISPFTVKNHLKRVYHKLNVSNRAQAASTIS